jgi:hypothetical protein
MRTRDLLGVVGILSAAPAGAAPAPPAKPVSPKLVRLSLLPPEVRLHGPLAAQRLLVVGTLSDGSQVDLTARAAYTSSSPTVAAVGGARVGSRGDGQATIAARYGGLAARAPVRVTGSHAPVVYSFRNDVVPVLSRVGCSQGGCHGANSGKGGFKLSLRGYAPELDFLSITRQYGGRRICREAPEESLLLRKPLGEVPHGGGKVLTKGSPEYHVLLGWLREGAPGVDPKDPALTTLTAYPGPRTYRPKESQRVLVRASFSDGHVEDVTDRAVYRTNDPAVAEVTREGEVTAQNPGDTAIQAKYMDQLAVVRVTVPYPQKINPAAFPKPVSYIDTLVQQKLKELRLEPSGPCSDEEFVRRAYVDVLGTLPTSDEARRFLDSRDPEKRSRLIDEVLQRPEYGLIWSLRLCDVFMVRREHMQRKNTLALAQWLAEQFNANRPWDEVVTDLVTAKGSTTENPATLWWISRQQSRPNNHGWIRHYELTGEIVAQVFLGQRIHCAQCHNHPTERYTQDDYYRFAAIFAQVNGDGPGDPVPARLIPKESGEVRQPRTGELMPPQPLDRTPWKLAAGDDRRVELAKWLAGLGRETLAKNIVNRIWARLFGSGIVEPVDDLRSTNPPKNGPLLDALARDLIAHRFDLKHLTAAIMRSRTYQTTSAATPKNRIDTQFFSRYAVRRLQAEELLDAIAQVTGVPDRFATYALGTRAIELTDTELSSLSLDVFGRPPRTTPCECDRSAAPSISQALDLFNGEALQAKLKSPDGVLAGLLKSGKPDVEIVEELFLRAFARRPAKKELAAVLTTLAASPSREEGMQDVLWALINSKEFMFAH